MSGFDEWRKYIHDQVVNMEYTGQPVLRHYNHLIVDDIREMYRAADEAKKIINQ